MEWPVYAGEFPEGPFFSMAAGVPADPIARNYPSPLKIIAAFAYGQYGGFPAIPMLFYQVDWQGETVSKLACVKKIVARYLFSRQ